MKILLLQRSVALSSMLSGVLGIRGCSRECTEAPGWMLFGATQPSARSVEQGEDMGLVRSAGQAVRCLHAKLWSAHSQVLVQTYGDQSRWLDTLAPSDA